jgi:FkbM family methyltransferase
MTGWRIPMRRVLKYGFGLASRLLPPLVKAKVCFDLAEQLGIRKLYATGDYGELLGYIDDHALFMRYVLERTYAPGIVTAFADFFAGRGGGTYLDIGANIGATTIPIARDRNVACFAFEPEPRNFSALEHNVLRNCNHANVRLFNLALFDRPGDLAFELSKENPGDHRVRIGDPSGRRDALGESRRQLITVKAARLDDLLSSERLRGPVCAKIDIQGAEANLYRGGRAVLGACEMIVTEFWPYGIARIGEDPVALLELFATDFPLCRIHPPSAVPDAAQAARATSRLGDHLSPLIRRARPEDWVDLELLKQERPRAARSRP